VKDNEGRHPESDQGINEKKTPIAEDALSNEFFGDVDPTWPRRWRLRILK
jgi:hypothetical protein